ncbi:MAG: hypothetical protein CMG57_06025 [Candidatus Marinimicrobia bacterium]|nr:hypothetical protein [Candidatus Neomarinimicrobiota bacterium]
MKMIHKAFYLPILISFLSAIDGTIIFFDGTTIEGNINSVDKATVYITPIGLDFPEEILMDNIDTLKLDNGKILVAGNEVLLMFENGNFISPGEKKQKRSKSKDDYVVEYVIVPNYSLNFYTGYPIIKATSFDIYNKSSPVFGLSVGTPYGFFMGDFFVNAIIEIANYKFMDSDGSRKFGGWAYQVGLSPGIFIGDLSISLTAATGVFHEGTGFIAGGSVDIPIGNLIMDKFGHMTIIDAMEEQIENLEVRITGRSNIVQKAKSAYDAGGATGWVGGGISIGYEF